METTEIIKRTFEALNFAPDSKERKLLNMDASTSEYMKSKKYLFLVHVPETETRLPITHTTSFETKAEAVEAQRLYLLHK